MDSATRRQLVGLLGLLVVAAAGALAFSPPAVVGELDGLAGRPLLFGAALLGLYLVRPLFLWPVTAFSLVLGYLFDPIVAVPLGLAGAAVSALPPFLVAKHGIDDAGVFGAVGEAGRRRFAEVGAFRGTLAARVSPIPGDAVSYGAGLSGVATGPFVAGTVVGELPWTLPAVAAGNSMAALSVGAVQPGPFVLVALACLALLCCWRPIVRRLGGEAPTATGS